MNISRNENTTYVTINYQQNKPIFEGKTVLITGGSTGIGFATAKMCIDNGAEVIITGRNLEKLKSAQNELGDRCCISQFDISDLKSIETEVDKIYKKFGKIDYLVANAGNPTKIHSFNDVDESEWERIVSVHLKGSYFITRKIYNKMVEQGICGSIVAVSSNGSFYGHLVPYGIAKAGLNNFVQGLSKVSIEKGIRCNAVAPGYTATCIFEQGGEYPDLNPDGNLYKGDIRGKRFHRPEEIAQVIIFLLSDASSCINGYVIPCDSGATVL